MQETCVHIYSSMGLFEEGVTLTLTVRLLVLYSSPPPPPAQ